MKKIFAFLLALLLIFGGSAFSESYLSPDVNSFTKIDGGYFTVSDFPNDMVPVEIVRVDMHIDFSDKSTSAKALFKPSYIPENLASIILTDGTHMAQAAFDIQEDAILLYFYIPDLMQFDSTVGLWLVMIEQVM